MTALFETAYPVLKSEPSPQELLSYSLQPEELALLNTIPRLTVLERCGLLLQFKTFQRIGRFIPTLEIPRPIRLQILASAGIKDAPTLKELRRYDASSARRSALAFMRKSLNVRPLTKSEATWLDGVAESAAQTKERLADIINVMLEELVHLRYELPAFSTLDRCAKSARERVHDRHFTSVNQRLSVSAKALIDDLFASAQHDEASTWHTLKREAKRPTNKEVRSYLQHINRLRYLAEQMPQVDIPVPKLRQYRNMARAMDAAEMANLKAAKRYALAVIFIRGQCAQALDDAADLFVRLMQNLENLAKTKLTEHQLERYKVTDMLVGQLKELLLAFKIDGDETQRINAMDDTLLADVDELVANCDEHLAFAGPVPPQLGSAERLISAALDGGGQPGTDPAAQALLRRLQAGG